MEKKNLEIRAEVKNIKNNKTIENIKETNILFKHIKLTNFSKE